MTKTPLDKTPLPDYIPHSTFACKKAEHFLDHGLTGMTGS